MKIKTYTPKPEDIQREWFVVDAKDQTLGRLATQIAVLLRGKHKPTFAPHVDGGDFVIVVNCEKIRVSGNKLDRTKFDVMLRDFYRLRNWDENTGLPRNEI